MTSTDTWLIINSDQNKIVGDRFYTSQQVVEILSALEKVPTDKPDEPPTYLLIRKRA